MFGGKNNALNRAYLAGLQAQTSVYGATIPVWYGRTRGNMLLIWFNHFREGAGLSQKKGKGLLAKKTTTNYVANTDFLLGHNPISGVLQFWYNNNKLSLNFQKVSGSIFYPLANYNGYATIPDPLYYALVGVTADVAYEETFDDYGAQGPVTVSGTFEMPLWNLNYAGPDPTNQNGYRQFPAVYQWIPGSGPTINFPCNAVSMIPGYTGIANAYYAQLAPGSWKLASKTKGQTDVPVTAMRLAFEGVLGSGNEYAPDPTQQILYPPYAGLQSSDFDMGAGGVAPAILPEVVGSFSVWPSGDADYADMIEDIFKSGPAQAGTGAAVAYGDIHHGLGCLDFPGTVQRKITWGIVEGWNNQIIFDLPNTAGNLLFCFANENSGNTLGISDTAGNSWIPLLPVVDSGIQVWYAVAVAAQSNKITIENNSNQLSLDIIEVAGLDTIDGSPVVVLGTTLPYGASITTTNKPGEDSLILSFAACSPGNGYVPPQPFHWERIVIGSSPADNNNTVIDSRATKYPGTYTVSYGDIGSGTIFSNVLIALKNSQPNTFTSPLGNILDDTTMQQTRLQCRAYGLNGSLVMDSQKQASDWLKELYQVADAAPVWSGFVLKSIPYAEQSMAGNGAIYISPTASGPIANMTEADFVASASEPPVTITRKAQVDAPNLQQIQSPNRDADYNQTVTAQPDNGSMSLYGTRKEAPKVFTSIQTSVVANMILGIMVREANIVRNSYSFKLQPKWANLEAMDLITIPLQSTMPAINPGQPVGGSIAVRLTSVSVDDKFVVECTAEPFIYGLRSPTALDAVVTTPGAQIPPFGADPGDVNVPIIFEAVPGLAGETNIGQLWLVLSGASPDYGGCIAYISTDAGRSYNLLGPNGGVIVGNATTGYSTADWPAAADPDTTHDLPLDLSESFGVLDSYSIQDEDNFTYPCYIAGPLSPVPTMIAAVNIGIGPDPPAAGGPKIHGDLTAPPTQVMLTAPMGNPFIQGVLQTLTIDDPGSGYIIGDLLTIVQLGGSGGTVEVTEVDGSGAITGFQIETPGTGYAVTTPAMPATTSGGTGTLATFNIIAVSGDIAFITVRFQSGQFGYLMLAGANGPTGSTWTTYVGNTVWPADGSIYWATLGGGNPNVYWSLTGAGSAVQFLAGIPTGDLFEPSVGYDGAICAWVIRGADPAKTLTDIVSGPDSPVIFQGFDSVGQTIGDTGWNMLYLTIFGPYFGTPLLVAYVTETADGGADWGTLPPGWVAAFAPEPELAYATGPVSVNTIYELMTYALADLTGPNEYTLKATGGGTNHLRRDVFGAPNLAGGGPGPPNFGIDHPYSGSPPNGSRFAWLDPNNPNAAGIMRLPLDPSWIGVTLYFKFTAFNTLTGGLQTLDEVEAYTYTVTGVPGGVNPNGITPQVFLVNGT